MQMILLFTDRNGSERRLHLSEESPCVVGRDALCQIQQSDRTLSAMHCRFLRHGNQCMVEDLGSTNGTFLKDRRLAANVPTLLQTGDWLRCGPLRIQIVIADAQSAAQESRPVASQASSSAPPKVDCAEPFGKAQDMQAPTEAALRDARRALERSQTERRMALNEVAALRADCASLREQLWQRSEECVRLKTELREAGLQLDVTRREFATVVASCRDQRCELVGQVDAADRRAEGARQHSNELQQELESLRQVNAEQRRQIESLSAELRFTQARVQDLSASHEQVQRLHEAASSRGASLEKQLDLLRGQTTQELRATREENRKLQALMNCAAAAAGGHSSS